jgi:hypothetical protein
MTNYEINNLTNELTKIDKYLKLREQLPRLEYNYNRCKEALNGCFADNGLNTTKVLEAQLKTLIKVRTEYLHKNLECNYLNLEIMQHDKLCADFANAGVIFTTDANLNIYIKHED